MRDEEKQRHYELAEKLLSEQNFPAALIAGAVAMLLAAAGYGVAVTIWPFSYVFAAAGIGILVGFPMGFLGRGIAPKFGVAAALYTIGGCILGKFVRVYMNASGMRSISALAERAIANIGFIDIVYWFVAVVCAVFLARRALSRKEKLAIGLYEMRR